MSKKATLKTGTVVWFNGRQGYGWISVDGEDQDAYVHFTDINAKGYRTLEDGQKVRFSLVRQEDDMLKAVKVTLPNGMPPRCGYLALSTSVSVLSVLTVFRLCLSAKYGH